MRNVGDLYLLKQVKQLSRPLYGSARVYEVPNDFALSRDMAGTIADVPRGGLYVRFFHGWTIAGFSHFLYGARPAHLFVRPSEQMPPEAV
ncbi:hypothetical protein MPLB_1870012 [Mesorhizobium sp. ORS 3324]|nr:hypothetical protein MPLB_1870012 [Mesorhizobium sp. ORS 3324]